MYPTKLHLKNFLSFEDQEYTFEQGKSLLIQGINNFKKESQESNGSGKSGLFCAMEYLYLQATSRKYTRDVKYIRRGCDESFVSNETYCPVRNQTLKIERTIPRKGSTTIKIYINGIDQKDVIATVPEGNKFIMDWLQITKEDLSNFFLIHEDKYTSFFLSPNSKKIELVSRFSKSNIIDGIDTLIQSDVSEFDVKIKIKSDDLISLQSKLDVYKTELVEENNRDFEKEKVNKIEQINFYIISNETDIKGYNAQISVLNKQLIEQTNLTKLIEFDINEITEQIASVLKDSALENDITNKKTNILEQETLIKEVNEINKNFKSSLTSIDSSIRSITVKLAGSITCPKCTYEFIPSGKENVEDLKKQKETLSTEKSKQELNIKESDILLGELGVTLQEYEKQLSSLKFKQNESEKKINDMKVNLRKVQNQLSEQTTSINRIKSNISNYEDNIITSQSSIDNYKKQIQQIKSSVFESKAKEIQIKIDSVIKDISKIEEDKILLEDDKSNIFQWIEYFKKFKSFIAQKSLLVLQTKMNENLKAMKSDFRLRLEGFKQKADGSLKEEITPIIIDNGEEIEFGELSGGEKMRIDFAGILTVQDVINETHPYGGLKFLFTDEVGGKSDALGFKLLMQSAPKDRCILIITQLSQQICEETLIIENNNGISKIK